LASALKYFAHRIFETFVFYIQADELIETQECLFSKIFAAWSLCLYRLSQHFSPNADYVSFLVICWRVLFFISWFKTFQLLEQSFVPPVFISLI